MARRPRINLRQIAYLEALEPRWLPSRFTPIPESFEQDDDTCEVRENDDRDEILFIHSQGLEGSSNSGTGSARLDGLSGENPHCDEEEINGDSFDTEGEDENIQCEDTDHLNNDDEAEEIGEEDDLPSIDSSYSSGHVGNENEPEAWETPTPVSGQGPMGSSSPTSVFNSRVGTSTVSAAVASLPDSPQGDSLVNRLHDLLWISDQDTRSEPEGPMVNDTDFYSDFSNETNPSAMAPAEVEGSLPAMSEIGQARINPSVLPELRNPGAGIVDALPIPSIDGIPNSSEPLPPNLEAIDVVGSNLLNMPALEAALQGLLQELDELGGKLLLGYFDRGMTPWLLAMITATAALEVGRRQLARSGLGRNGKRHWANTLGLPALEAGIPELA